jgi:hypothetical protein
MGRLEAICQGQLIEEKNEKFCMSDDVNGSTQMIGYECTYSTQNSHFLDSNPLFLLFRVHVVDISLIDEQHKTQRKMMMNKKVVRFYTSLHYVIDVCHIHYSSFISLFIIIMRKKKKKSLFHAQRKRI